MKPCIEIIVEWKDKHDSWHYINRDQLALFMSQFSDPFLTVEITRMQIMPNAFCAVDTTFDPMPS